MSSVSKHFLLAKPLPIPKDTDVLTSTLSKVRRRSTSLVSSFKGLLPANRPEKGGTIRKRGCYSSEYWENSSRPNGRSGLSVAPNSVSDVANKFSRWNAALELAPQAPPSATITTDSSPSTRSLVLYLERSDKRQQRRSLKESGDYLGVQGINPSTGEMDVLTPSSSSTSSPKFASLTRSVQDKREAYERARRVLRSEKMRRWEMDKEALKLERKRKVKWAKAGSGWTSVMEPDLSPISGSNASTPGEGSTATVVRTPRYRSEEDESGPEDQTIRAFTESISLPGPAVTLATSAGSIAIGIPRKPVPIASRAPGSVLKSSTTSSNTRAPCDGHGHPRPDSPAFGHWQNRGKFVSANWQIPPDLPPKARPRPAG